MGDFGSQEREEREGSDELGEDLRRGEIGVCGMRGGHRSGRGGALELGIEPAQRVILLGTARAGAACRTREGVQLRVSKRLQ